MASRKLRHYFQAHEITVVTRFPLQRILQNPDATDRIVEWALELSSFDLKFESTSTIQSRALAEFIAEWTPTPDEELTIDSEEAHHLHGILDQITANYWIVSGEVIYIISSTQIDEGIDIGEYISVHIKTEQNGSYTAIEITRNENGGKPEDIEGHETPEGKGDGEEQGRRRMSPPSDAPEA